MAAHSPNASETSLSSVSLTTQIICVLVITACVSSRYIIKHKLRLPFELEDNPFSMVLRCVFYIAAFFYVPMILSVKLALLFMLLRVFQPSNKRFTFLHIFIVLIMCYYVAIFFVKIFICDPISAYWKDWKSKDNRASCLNRSAVIVADSTITGVILILGAGCIAVAFSLYRLILLCIGFKTLQEMSLILKILLTDNAEGGLGLICACLPALNKFLHALKSSKQTPRT
ncbi:hypothetical protein BDV59DRAFT_193391 [Aspergillus ambiguus]|uniref:uncharacterized protein n=1 Tax=Aspergillus ambiguus TaxID=176160 RepID=UPI003CCE0C21